MPVCGAALPYLRSSCACTLATKESQPQSSRPCSRQREPQCHQYGTCHMCSSHGTGCALAQISGRQVALNGSQSSNRCFERPTCPSTANTSGLLAVYKTNSHPARAALPPLLSVLLQPPILRGHLSTHSAGSLPCGAISTADFWNTVKQTNKQTSEHGVATS